MKAVTSIFLAAALVLVLAGAAAASPTAAGTIPTISITSVVAGQSVTIQTFNFPASQTFEVRMGKIGTLGIGGIMVASTDSGDGGTFTQTYAIPAELQQDPLIAIRLDSPQGFFSYNWFYNVTAQATPFVPTPSTPNATPSPTTAPTSAPTAAPTPSATQAPASGAIPTFTITSVVQDQQVSIETADFPANQEFQVTMGKMGTQGVGGIVVDRVNSGEGGSFVGVYNIPAELAGESQIAIRLQSNSGFFSYNWFYNTTTTP